jgi:hypothetical protein
VINREQLEAFRAERLSMKDYIAVAIAEVALDRVPASWETLKLLDAKGREDFYGYMGACPTVPSVAVEVVERLLAQAADRVTAIRIERRDRPKSGMGSASPRYELHTACCDICLAADSSLEQIQRLDSSARKLGPEKLVIIDYGDPPRGYFSTTEEERAAR